MRLAFVVALALGGSSALATAAGPMYRWVDARGQVHYTQTPPSAGSYKEVTPRRAPTASPAPSRPAPEARVPSPASVAAMNQKTAEYNETIRAQNCKNAQARVAAVKAQGPASTLRQQPDGTVVPYAEADYQRELTEAQKAVGEVCPRS